VHEQPFATLLLVAGELPAISDVVEKQKSG
jgi:hypothetical protein